MSTQVTQFKTALLVNPSDNVPIPYPSVIVQGTTDDSLQGAIADGSTKFSNKNINYGDIAYVAGSAYIVKGFDKENDNILLLDTDDTISQDEGYVIYAGGNNNGCTLYVSGMPESGIATLKVETIEGSVITLTNLITEANDAGVFVPIQVIKVYSTDTNISNIIALW